MAFQSSPKLDNPSKPVRTFSGWLYALRPAFLTLTVLLILFDIAYMALRTRGAGNPLPPGGLDGCITTKSGTPLVGTAKVGEVSSLTDENGCFFFPALQPGTQQLQITSDTGIVYQQAVSIVSNQAVELGTLKVGP